MLTLLVTLSMMLSLASLFGISYHKKRISELTLALGHLIEELDKTQKKFEHINQEEIT